MLVKVAERFCLLLIGHWHYGFEPYSQHTCMSPRVLGKQRLCSGSIPVQEVTADVYNNMKLR